MTYPFVFNTAVCAHVCVRQSHSSNMSLSLHNTDATIVICVLCKYDTWRTKVLWDAWAHASNERVAYVMAHTSGRAVTPAFEEFKSIGIGYDIPLAELTLYVNARQKYKSAKGFLFIHDSTCPVSSIESSILTQFPIQTTFVFNVVRGVQVIAEVDVAPLPSWMKGDQFAIGESHRLLNRPAVDALGGNAEKILVEFIDIFNHITLDEEVDVPYERMAVPTILYHRFGKREIMNASLLYNPHDGEFPLTDELELDQFRVAADEAVLTSAPIFLYRFAHPTDELLTHVLRIMTTIGLVLDDLTGVNERRNIEQIEEQEEFDHENLIDNSAGQSIMFPNFEVNRREAIVIAWGWILFFMNTRGEFHARYHKNDIVIAVSVIAHYLYGLHPFKQTNRNSMDRWAEVTIAAADAFITHAMGGRQGMLPVTRYWDLMQFGPPPLLSINNAPEMPFFGDATEEGTPPIMSVCSMLSRPPIWTYSIREFGKDAIIPTSTIKLGSDSMMYFTFDDIQPPIPMPVSVIPHIKVPPVDIDIVQQSINNAPAQFRKGGILGVSILVDRLKRAIDAK